MHDGYTPTMCTGRMGIIAGITGVVVRIEARRKKTGVLIHEDGDIGIVGNGL